MQKHYPPSDNRIFPVLSRLFITCCLLPASALADIPLTIDDLLTAQNRWRAELGLSYSNANQQKVSTGQPIFVQVGPVQYIALPTRIGESRVNSDTLVLTPGLRYGLSGKTELYGRSSWIADSTRIQDINGQQSQSDNRFESLWLGVNHKFISEGKSPALLVFLEMAAIENFKLSASSDTHMVSAHSWLVGATTYRVIDPMVLSLTAAYRANLARDIDDTDYKPGNYLLLNPSASFAVNNEITLSGGFQWTNMQPTIINGVEQGTRSTNTNMNLGLAWLWDERSTLNFSGRANISGNNSAGLGLTWTYKLGYLPLRKPLGKSTSL
ncbi:MAG: transporter [Methylotenera sp.]|uniref:transporter n=1 Tax=Methylotenera sp. TaxID=2051956 RepID=UPI002721D4DD|nr:transporter [Methylotenera sp.]MDO9394834.1 transporter [Methylotenera sp.]